MTDGWTTIGHLADCESCPFGRARRARYDWWRRGTTSWCPVHLCVECCAEWRAEVEKSVRPTPLRISEIYNADCREESRPA